MTSPDNLIYVFTITAEMLAPSLANCYRQYADRHMNLKFERHVSEREQAIRPFAAVRERSPRSLWTCGLWHC